MSLSESYQPAPRWAPNVGSGLVVGQSSQREHRGSKTTSTFTIPRPRPDCPLLQPAQHERERAEHELSSGSPSSLSASPHCPSPWGGSGRGRRDAAHGSISRSRRCSSGGGVSLRVDWSRSSCGHSVRIRARAASRVVGEAAAGRLDRQGLEAAAR